MSRTEYVILLNQERRSYWYGAWSAGTFNDTIHIEKARTWKKRSKAWQAIERWDIVGATVVPVTVIRTVTEDAK